MSLGNDEHENDPTNAGDQVAPNQHGEGDQGPRPIAALFQPPQPPAPPTPPDQHSSKWRENAKMIFEIVGLTVLIAYTVFSCLQWLQIRWTNRLTREALNGNTYALNQTLAKMQGQIDAMNKQAGQTAKLTADTHDLAVAAKDQARASKQTAGTAQETFTKGSRPWVGPDGVLTLTQPVQIKMSQNGNMVVLLKAMSSKFTVKNFGRDPAMFVKPVDKIVEPTIVADVNALDATINKAQDDTCKLSDKQAISGPIPGGAIFPGATAEFEDLSIGLIRTIPVAQFDEKREAGLDGQLMVAGCITYFDQFKAIHHTRYCFISNDPISKLGVGSQLRSCHGSQYAE